MNQNKSLTEKNEDILPPVRLEAAPLEETTDPKYRRTKILDWLDKSS